MHDIMPNRVKGKHTFCTSMQSHGAAALNPSLSNGNGKGKEMEMEMEMDIDGADDKLVTIAKPPALTTGPIPIPSSASASSSKCKHSALGKDNSAMSGSHNSGKRKQHSTALDEVK